MNVKILGPGCANCRRLETNTREALARLGLEAQIEKVQDIPAIMRYGIMSTPGLVVDEEVKVYGRVPSPREIAALLQEAG
jgi:small redox-active disulfide protein 2